MYSDNTEQHLLRVCHVNCQSLMAYLDDFRLFFTDSQYDIICLSETWLKPAIHDQMVELSGYQLFRYDRTGKSRGGVAFFLANTLNARILKTSGSDYSRKPEFLIAEISSGDEKVLLAVVYRPPHCGHLNDFFTIVADILVQYRHCVIFGDFNADLMQTSYDSNSIMTYITTSSMYLVPYAPTHHTANSATLLDLCIVDDAEKLVSFQQHSIGFLSSHDLIDITFNIYVKRCSARIIISVRDFTAFDNEVFLSELAGCNWDALLQAENIDEKILLLNKYLLNCYNKHAPLKTIHSKRLPAPWITPYIKAKMSERDRSRRKWRRHKTDSNYNSFRVLRNQVQDLVRKAKQNYYLSVFSDLKKPTYTWMKL
ncbi:uncharacterized protein LOC109861696 [Pseudomyrmex gracilis]|uniref:uncharacterized protein LOC109861696 n=1 Tax=Pseudomyrmex gracilis TaxID=219809 RepID=UPI000995529E|nr:uncharacterized protein LOC109861696 [Pseudomyrmex gracilis]